MKWARIGAVLTVVGSFIELVVGVAELRRERKRVPDPLTVLY
ncbi:Uncharacterised protein [Mycobacteroides abscessus subsp. abscessus]|uniref:Uncharacterized protein n=1 Tax=Mycobacteroides abscessus subsp. abscessus TaxID=1185650 RepID=A0AB38CVB8_9MYCO|nr:Uncharacterised protein [Mycobacteroides abscessus]SHZ97675.1 Uncharacterised protein [Mycobacteroides abscessus subsp. abscessus]CPS05325.1 Uncharacterised protein [Mycobacteroides abscessus]CPS67890.1 Uncharacterised protein [Mycobacteroides abscessus]CPV16830.1 Uncharacterised protein [Mycobacteroides abscessus]